MPTKYFKQNIDKYKVNLCIMFIFFIAVAHEKKMENVRRFHKNVFNVSFNSSLREFMNEILMNFCQLMQELTLNLPNRFQETE